MGKQVHVLLTFFVIAVVVALVTFQAVIAVHLCCEFPLISIGWVCFRHNSLYAVLHSRTPLSCFLTYAYGFILRAFSLLAIHDVL